MQWIVYIYIELLFELFLNTWNALLMHSHNCYIYGNLNTVNKLHNFTPVSPGVKYCSIGLEVWCMKCLRIEIKMTAALLWYPHDPRRIRVFVLFCFLSKKTCPFISSQGSGSTDRRRLVWIPKNSLQRKPKTHWSLTIPFPQERITRSAPK